MHGTRKFFFSCPHCGAYEVERETLIRFLSPLLKTEREREERKGRIASFTLTFEDSCPRCDPEGVSEATLSSIKKKVH